MNYLNIQTTAMAQSLHVDASLVSKWKTGSRNLTPNSVYFNDVVNYLLDSSKENSYYKLKEILFDLFPQENFSDSDEIEEFLRYALSDGISQAQREERTVFSRNAQSSQVTGFIGNAGRREAIDRIIDYAESMNDIGEIMLIDSEEFRWLWEDAEFAQKFKDRIKNLLKKGFHATIHIHYSPSEENFQRFFKLCSPIIFHRNVEWFYSAYYDEPLISFSAFMINHAVLLMGMSVENSGIVSVVSTDKQMILQQKSLLESAIRKGRRIFSDFKPFELSNVVDNIINFRKNGAFFSFLPVPAFITVQPELLEEILNDNNVDYNQKAKVMQLNKDFRKITESYCSNGKERFVQIFQLEKMLNRIERRSFISRSLSLSCGKDIIINPRHHAKELLHIVSMLENNQNVQIVIVSEKDEITLPMISCWCRENSYMLQLDKKSFRASTEGIVVNSATIALEDCIRRVPPERKDKSSVISFLLEQAEELKHGECEI